jgi:hypothetical protein
VRTDHDGEKPFRVDGLAPGYAHSTIRTSVVASLHADDVLFSRSSACDFDGSFDGFRTRVPEEKGVKGGVWHHRDQLFNEAEIWLMECNAALFDIQR